MAVRGYDDNGLGPPTPDRVDRALGTFWRGSADEFERLVGPRRGEDIGICELLRLVALALRFAPPGFWVEETDHRSSRTIRVGE